MKKKYKVILSIIVVLIIVIASLFLYNCFFSKSNTSTSVNTVTVTNTIADYGYNLEDRDTLLFKEKFEELKTLLVNQDYDQEEYISLVSQLFIIDLYTINNKLSQYDIGGLEYVYSDAVTSFKTVVQNSIYKAVENNLDGSRTQKLPEVASVEVTSISEYSYTMPDDSKQDGYKVKLVWSYVTDLGYDSKGTLLLIPDGDKYGVVYFEP